MQKNRVITSVELAGNVKTSIYVDDENFYNEVQVKLIKEGRTLRSLVEEALVEFVRKNSDIEISKDDEKLYRKAKSVMGLEGTNLKEVVNAKMREYVRE